MTQAVLDRLYALRNAAAGFQLQVEDLIREATGELVSLPGGICKATGGEHPREQRQSVSSFGSGIVPRYRCGACDAEWADVSQDNEERTRR